MENLYQNPPAQSPTPEPSQQVQKIYRKEVAGKKPSSLWQAVLAIVIVLGFAVTGLAGVLVSQKQYLTEGPVAPNVPQSQPAAYIAKATCTLTFNVNAVPTPTPTGTLTPTPTPTGTVTPTPTATPTPTPVPLECGETPCDDNFDCADDLICITADNGDNYCSRSEYRNACTDNPSESSCCSAPNATPTPTNTPTPTIISVVSGEQPEIPEELPVAGPEDWLKYLQVGLGVLGAGALLLLLL